MEYNPDLHSLQCPKCQHGMTAVTHEGITIDRCTQCEGLWFDGDEAQQLKNIPGGEALDTGGANKGRGYDDRGDIRCPHCHKPMEKSADWKQVHIWYEVCRDHGIFMDAGEFTDFKSNSPLDFFRGLIKGKRKDTGMR
jgi:Zn-finger nucleic acid-binding protein